MDFEARFHSQLEELRARDQYRSLVPSEGVSFVNNDYLGLSRHPRVREAAIHALEIYGTGSTGSRLLGGHSTLFEDAEKAFADYFESPAALILTSGYHANLALMSVLAPLVDEVWSDALNHASLIDGLRLTPTAKHIYPHAQLPCAPKGVPLVVSESLFSMDGDIARLEELVDYVERHAGFLVVDEAHAAGVFPETGRGLLSLWPFPVGRCARVVTFGKALGGTGAVILCTAALKALLINQARTFIYTTAPAPASVAAAVAALGVLKEEAWRREELWSRAEEVREILSEIPYVSGKSGVPPARTLWERRSPIIPVFVGDAARAMSFAQSMRETGVELRAIRYPTVKRGSERLRISLNLNVSSDNTSEMARQMVRVWKEFS